MHPFFLGSTDSGDSAVDFVADQIRFSKCLFSLVAGRLFSALEWDFKRA